MPPLTAAIDPAGLARLLALTLLAALVGAVIAVVYRWYVRESIPDGAALMLGLGAVGIALNTTALLGATVGGTADPFATGRVAVNVVTFGTAAIAAPAGARAGDRLATGTLSFPSVGDERDLGRVVRSAGRVLTVELPETIDDLPDHDGVPPATKERLAGRTLVFPRGLTVTELHDRLVERLRTDYRVGQVDLDLADDGTVISLAIGGRTAGIGSTLAPGTTAVAVRADPAFTTGVGDTVQCWSLADRDDGQTVRDDTSAGSDPPELLTTAEVRGVAGDVVTLAVDAADAPALAARDLRLVTLPRSPRADRAFAALLRRADETMGVVTVAEGSALTGTPVGALDVPIVAIKPDGAAIVPLPGRDRVLAAGDRCYVVGRPPAIRALEAAAVASSE
jgi:hypothetical protein